MNDTQRRRKQWGCHERLAHQPSSCMVKRTWTQNYTTIVKCQYECKIHYLYRLFSHTMWNTLGVFDMSERNILHLLVGQFCSSSDFFFPITEGLHFTHMYHFQASNKTHSFVLYLVIRSHFCNSLYVTFYCSDTHSHR